MEAQLSVGCERVASGPLQGSAAEAIMWADRVRRLSGRRCDGVVASKGSVAVAALQEEV